MKFSDFQSNFDKKSTKYIQFFIEKIKKNMIF